MRSFCLIVEQALWRCNSVIRAIRGHLSPSDQQSKLRQGLMGKQSGVFVTWYTIPMQSNAKLIQIKTGSINKDKTRFKAKKVYKLKNILQFIYHGRSHQR